MGNWNCILWLNQRLFFMYRYFAIKISVTVGKPSVKSYLSLHLLIQPSVAKTGIFQENLHNGMAADALSSCSARSNDLEVHGVRASAAAMSLSVRYKSYKRAIDFHRGGSQQNAPSTWVFGVGWGVSFIYSGGVSVGGVGCILWNGVLWYHFTLGFTVWYDVPIVM